VFLVDTNVWIEHLLAQERAEEAASFLTRTASDTICISAFSLHSICLIMARLKAREKLLEFIEDVIVGAEVQVATIEPADLPLVLAAMSAQRLDFDDAYQFVVAQQRGLVLVSFDRDFDHSDLARLTPAQALAKWPPV
jgi:uncharacterized protein